MSLLKVEDLCVSFETPTRRVNAVRNATFDLAAGERLGFVGESGSGKTTTALALMGLTPPPGKVMRGRVRLGELELLELSSADINSHRLKTMSYVPQGAMNSLNPVLKVRESILDGMADHGVRFSKDEATKYVEELLDKVGLPGSVAQRYPHELSGGMKQRVCIAVAIALRPQLLIADEPTSALDVITQRQVMETLGAVQKDLGSGLILIGHDMGLMAQFVDRLIVMRNGQIVEDVKTRTAFATPKHDYTKHLIASVPKLPKRKEGSAQKDDVYTPQKPPTRPLLALENVSMSFSTGFLKKPFQAVKPLSMQFSQDHPKIIALVGQSGSGKSTLGRIMMGFQKPSSGRVLFEGKDIAAMSRNEKVTFRQSVQAVFQDPYASFNPFYTVDHAFLIPLIRFGIAQDRKDAYARMEDALGKVGLDPKSTFGAHAHQLSGGQRQRLMVARALALRPKILVADEPVSMVDASLRSSILDSICALRDDLGISVLYITHDLATAYQSSDGVVVLHQGQVVEAGLPSDVIEDPVHPYSQLLVDSIPAPDPDQVWAGGRKLTDDLIAASASATSAPTVMRGAIEGFHFEGR